MANRSVRANHTMHVISRLKQLPEPTRSALLADVPHVRMAVRNAGLFGWIPVELHIELTDRIAHRLSHGAALAFWRELALDSFSRPLIRPIVSAALAMHGRSPETLLLRAPTLLNLVLRDCGELEIEGHWDCRVIITCAGLVAPIRSSPGMRAFIEGALAAPFVHLRVPGAVRPAPGSRGLTARYDVRWSSETPGAVAKR